MALPEEPISLEAGHLDHAELRLRDADVDQRLHLEPVAVDVDAVQTTRPEGVVSVAEVRIVGAVENVHERYEKAVPKTADDRDVAATAAVCKSRALGEICSAFQRVHESWNLCRVRRSVGVQHHDDVAAGSREA